MRISKDSLLELELARAYCQLSACVGPGWAAAQSHRACSGSPMRTCYAWIEARCCHRHMQAFIKHFEDTLNDMPELPRVRVCVVHAEWASGAGDGRDPGPVGGWRLAPPMAYGGCNCMCLGRGKGGWGWGGGTMREWEGGGGG